MTSQKVTGNRNHARLEIPVVDQLTEQVAIVKPSDIPGPPLILGSIEVEAFRQGADAT